MSTNNILNTTRLIEVTENNDCRALADFEMGGIPISEGDMGGKALNVSSKSCGLAIDNSSRTSLPVVWVKSGAFHDFGGKDVSKDFLWCHLANKLEDSYTDEHGETHYSLKEDNPDVLWLLDDLDAFMQVGVDKVDVTPAKILTPVEDNGKTYNVDRGQLSAFNAETKTVILPLYTTIESFNAFIKSWNKRCHNLTLQDSPLLGDKRIYFQAFVALQYVYALVGNAQKAVSILEDFNKQPNLKLYVNMEIVNKYLSYYK